MNDTKKKLLDAGAAATIASGGAVASALIAGTALAPPVSVAVATTLVGIGVRELIGKSLRTSLNSRVERWLEDVAAASEFGTKERVEEEIDAHIDEDWARGGLTESFRVLLAALDEAAIPIIAHLTADYLTNKAKPDSFFRSLGDLVSTMDSNDIDMLRTLIGALASAAWPAGVDTADVLFNDVARIRCNADGKDTELAQASIPRSAWLRITALLKRHTLAADGTSRWGTSSADTLQIDVAVAKRVAKYIGAAG